MHLLLVNIVIQFSLPSFSPALADYLQAKTITWFQKTELNKNGAIKRWRKLFSLHTQIYIRMKELKQVIRGQDLLSGLYLILQIEEENKSLVKKEKYLYVKLHLLMKHSIFCRLYLQNCGNVLS
ncbi:hypothetical protein Anas_12434 [Armadillidium nasatum]|uniref:Uncharacterized protein n=1 Tax=Armadillidium nasatum TaxID=96803 RepID=A0A5N5SLV6_9CRUS|nr:hypothetical protein Anas_09105 [Armadillidium nasatum]KAB7495685.1 hypothetical protein Anas_03851 [Armadillidium nasatum]KAB7497447.1 hypothetical protein Anas_12434 [Armadillidium nasatum]